MSLRDAISQADLLVVGSGFFGVTIAERAASEGFKVVVIDRRDHLGGNSYSFEDEETGIEVHKYGTHIFHTSNSRVWEYANRFTEFNQYRHHVFTVHGEKVYPMPISLATLSAYFGRSISPSEARALMNDLQSVKKSGRPKNLEEKAISLIGKDLYEAFILGYTKKQWGKDPKDLPAETITRLPVRFDYNTRYFSDTWEGIPALGYHAWIKNMLASTNISSFTNTDFFDVRELYPAGKPIVYTGPIDRYFDYSLGILGWRTLDFENRILEVSDYQGTSVMNYADEGTPYTRVHEYFHLQPEKINPSSHRKQTYISFEYSRQAGIQDEPYYPINSDSDKILYDSYRKLAEKEESVVFGGRLGTYRYLDMHMAIGGALTAYDAEVRPRLPND